MYEIFGYVILYTCYGFMLYFLCSAMYRLRQIGTNHTIPEFDELGNPIKKDLPEDLLGRRANSLIKAGANATSEKLDNLQE